MFCIAFILIGTVLSCTTNELDLKQIPSEKNEDITIDMPLTKGNVNTGDPNDSVAMARLIIIKGGKVQVNEKKEYSEILGSSDIIFRDIEVPVGYADFFMITNEASANWNFDAGQYQKGSYLQSSVLKREILNYTTNPQVGDGLPPIPMVGIHEGLYAHTDSLTYKEWGTVNQAVVNSGDVKRLYAKVSLNVDCIFSQMPNGGEPLTIKKITVKNLPKKSYLSPFRYAENNFFEHDITLNSQNYTRTGQRFDGNFSFYVPEYLVSDTSKYTHILLQVSLVNDPTIVRNYRIVVGNGIQGTNKNEYLLGLTKTAEDLVIDRNTHYEITAHLKGFDGTSGSDLTIVGKIVDWNTKPTDPEKPQEYSLDITTSNLTVPSGMGTSGTPYEGIIHITTDYTKGWTATQGTGTSGVTFPGHTFPEGGKQLKFRIAGGSSPWTINVTAGKITKRITLTQ